METKVDPTHVWTANEAAELVRRHPVSIRRACREGQLHGEQPVKGGHWLIEDQCLAAYRKGEKCVHRENVSQMPRFGSRHKAKKPEAATSGQTNR